MDLDRILKLAENGRISAEALNSALGSIEPEAIEEVLEALEQRGISVDYGDKRSAKRRVPPLPAEATVPLSELRAMEEGAIKPAGEAWFEVVGSYEPLDPREEAALARRIEEGEEEALRLMVMSNLRLVAETARSFVGRGVARLDLVQEGNAALVRAASRFRTGRGYRFASWARWWIKTAMARALSAQSRAIRLPRKLGRLLKRIYEQRAMLAQRLGREPSDSELAEAVGIAERQLAEIRELLAPPLSLEAPVRGEETSSLADFIDNLGEEETGAEERAVLRTMLNNLLRDLPPEAQRVLALRYGIGDEGPYSVEQTAHRLGMNEKQVQAIEQQALEAMRKPFAEDPSLRN
ncbi:MAG: hypothetical protein C4341_05930 [Armatimonadota bacterium]